jgi:sigma-E factor negative regulatory protein RseB
MRFTPIALLTWGMAVCAPVQANDASNWLSRMNQAEQQRNFDGIFVYEREGAFSTHQVWQRVDAKGGVRERLLQLDGPVREVFSIDGQVQCVGAGSGEQFSQKTHWRGQVTEVSEVARHFDLRLVGDARVAGRATVVIAVIPKDQHRYGYELHLDRASGLPLKSLLLDEKGQQLERLQFTQLDLEVSSDADALQPGKGCVAVTEQVEPAQLEPRWATEWLPPGFRLERYSETARANSDKPLSLLTFVGPLARFSVFVEPLDGVRVDDARSQLGPTVVVSKRMAADAGDMMVTVVGEIPLGTAERVALSMRERVADEG